MGFNAWNTFVLRVEHPYIARKLEKPLDMGELTLHAEKTECYRLQQQTCFSFSVANYSRKLHKIQHIDLDDFTEHYIIRYLSALSYLPEL